jgi:3D (Asp-Asp-Asp) domain-containing protein
VQPDIREVVLLDRGAEALVDLVDLRKHLLSLLLLGSDAAGVRIRRSDRDERAYAQKECLRLSFHQWATTESTGAVPEGAGPHKFGTLAALSDVCNRFSSQKLPLSGKYRDRTKSPFSAVSRQEHAGNITLCDEGHNTIRLVGSGLVRGGRESRLAFGLALLAAVFVGASLAGAQNTATLQQHQRVLVTRSHSALLGLYALDSRLSRARNDLARIHARVTALRAEQQQVQDEVKIVARNLRVSQRLLATHLRTLYEEGEPNALAILLGSTSLDDAVTRLNDLEQSAQQGQTAVTDAEQGRTQLTELAAKLASQVRQAQALEGRARTTAKALAQARAARVGYLASLARQRQLTAHQISRLDTRARRVVEQAQTIQARATAPAPPVWSAPGAITVTATGYSLPGHTATGLPVGYGVVAVDPGVIPLGTRMTIPGYGEGVAADTGSGVSGYAIDLWFPTLADALAWGRRTVTITLH